MKVLILTTSTGGPLTWAKQLTNYFKKKYPEIEITYKNDKKSLFLAPFYIGDYDMVHSIIPLPFKFWKQPLILNIRGNYKKEFNRNNPYSILYPLAKRCATLLLVQSKFLAKKINLKKYELIPNAVDASKIKEKKSYATSNKLKLVILTSFAFKEKAKGILSLVSSLENLPKSLSYELDIFGDGLYLNDIKKQITNSNISFKGKDLNAKNKLSSYDIFTYYSHLDNFPNTVLEAMAAGLPIVSNDVGAVSEMLDSNVDGFIVKSDAEFTKAIQQLAKSENLRKKMGAAAKLKVKKEFSWDVIAKKYVELYRGVFDAR